MYRAMKVAAVIPALNEECLIERTLADVPDIVDAVYVVDDGSTDSTAQKVLRIAESDPRVNLIRHKHNRGVGAAIISGYKRSFEEANDVSVVVGGDAQMDWNDLEHLLLPIKLGYADYTKGNRFIYGNSTDTAGNAWCEMPLKRILGNVTLSILTKFASGYYHLNDSQMGYTAMHRRVFPLIDWEKTRQGYGYPAEWLMQFHSKCIRILDVPVRAIYLANERQTQIKVRKFMFYMLAVIIKGGLNRLYREYLHPNSGRTYRNMFLAKRSRENNGPR